MRLTNTHQVTPVTSGPTPKIGININYSPGQVLRVTTPRAATFSREPVGIHAPTKIPVSKSMPIQTNRY